MRYSAGVLICSIGQRHRSFRWIMAFMVACVTVAQGADATDRATVWQKWEHTLISDRDYQNPFRDVTVSVTYSGPNETRFKCLAFWDGKNAFKLRCAFPAPGLWFWQTSCSDTADAGLHDMKGKVNVSRYNGNNPLYKHGFLKVSPDRRYLMHADGTLFLWAGDTHWAATTLLTERGFQRWVDDRAAKNFTVLQTNIARFKENKVDAKGNRLWDGDRWNIDFMKKLDREFDYANRKGLVLFLNGLIDLKWDLKIKDYPRLIQMIAARYYAHFISYSSSMDDGYSTEHDEIDALIDQITTRHLLTQHTGTSARHPLTYFNRAYLDYSMSQSGHHGNNDERASQAAIAWNLNLYGQRPPKPIINGEAWYEGMATAEQAVIMGYLSMLSGCCGYTYGAIEQEGDDKLAALLNRKGSIYMMYLHNFFADINGGRCLIPRHEMIQNQDSAYRNKMVLAMTADETKYVGFLRHGGKILVDLRGVSKPISGKWFNATTGEYGGSFSTSGGKVCSFSSVFEAAPSLVILEIVD